MENEKKKRIYSAIQPTGTLNIGGYLGAVKNWIDFQDEYECIYTIADLHSLTVRNDPALLRKQSLEIFATLLACGIDPEKSLLFFQSHVPQHTQLSWALSCYTMFGELGRMTQFKDKSAKHADNVNAGLYTYPVLMAADILLYQADLVPIGEDQRQHMELCRDIAMRFNGVYGDVFNIPEGFIPKVGARIKSLTEPDKKMSKSDENDNSRINVLDSRDVIIRKCKKAVTDSEACVRYAEGKDGINNLMTMYSVFTGRSFSEIEHDFEGQGYGVFKEAVSVAIADALAPVKAKFDDYMADKSQLETIWRTSAERASYIADKTVRKVYKKLGLLQK